MTTTQRGFSLLELSIALVIAALLGSGLLFRLSAQREQIDRQEALRQLDLLRDSLRGYALAHGRLPCPADPALPDADAAAGLENCARQHGALPWITLGVPGRDPWGRRYTYYASERFSGAPLTPGGAAFTLDTDGNAIVYDDTGKIVASGLPTALLSHGPNGAGGWLADGSRTTDGSSGEQENADADLSFISPTPGNSANDDLLYWITADQMKAWLVSGGRLP